MQNKTIHFISYFFIIRIYWYSACGIFWQSICNIYWQYCWYTIHDAFNNFVTHNYWSINNTYLNTYYFRKSLYKDFNYNLFCTVRTFYTHMFHYFIFYLKYMLHYWNCVDNHIKYGFLMFLLHLFNIYVFCFTQNTVFGR